MTVSSTDPSPLEDCVTSSVCRLWDRTDFPVRTSWVVYRQPRKDREVMSDSGVRERVSTRIVGRMIEDTVDTTGIDNIQ